MIEATRGRVNALGGQAAASQLAKIDELASQIAGAQDLLRRPMPTISPPRTGTVVVRPSKSRRMW
jgi:hypothetical protein